MDVTGYWRWTEIGNRGSDFTDDAWDFVTALTYQLNDNVEVQTSFQYNNFYGVDVGRYFLDYAGLDSNLYQGVPFGSEDGVYAMSATTLVEYGNCLLYTSPSPRDRTRSRMPSSA